MNLIERIREDHKKYMPIGVEPVEKLCKAIEAMESLVKFVAIFDDDAKECATIVEELLK